VRPLGVFFLSEARGITAAELEREALFDRAHLIDRVLESVRAEHPLLDVFEAVADLDELPWREQLPGVEDDRVLDRRVLLVHQRECVEVSRERPGRGKGDRALGRGEDVLGDLAPAADAERSACRRRPRVLSH
jgi:hypothetical protein